MDYLKQFNKDFISGQIPIRDYYCSPDQDNEDKNDVINDLLNVPVAVVCLPVAKQISTTDHLVTFKLPRLGDAFLGIKDCSIIENVTLNIYNQTDTIQIEGELNHELDLWFFTQIPIPLIALSDYDSMYAKVNIHLNSSYNIQIANQDVFKAYYGYFNKSCQYQILNQAVYLLPLANTTENKALEIICGLWRVK